MVDISERYALLKEGHNIAMVFTGIRHFRHWGKPGTDGTHRSPRDIIVPGGLS